MFTWLTNALSALPFSAPMFIAAGALFALGPVVIHLLNRRRFRVVDWAAMDFLREAIHRNRRIMDLRDIFILLLRTAAILLFAAALARPFWSSGQAEFNPTQPVHAVLLVDNSLSMGVESLQGTLLDEAKTRAEEYIKALPAGSRVSVVPLCGSAAGFGLDPFANPDDAIDALKNIRVVDRSADVMAAANLAKKATEAYPELAKRVVYLGDQQLSNWRGVTSPESLENVPEMQVVSLPPRDTENASIASFSIQDGIADVETPAKLVVEVRYEGGTARPDVPVTLAIDGVEVATKPIHLPAGSGTREIVFEYTFDGILPEPGRAVFVPARVSISNDRLPGDDERFLSIPVVAALPVVFVDQYGAEEEDAGRDKVGETKQLRKWLAPIARRDDPRRQLVQIRHVKVDQLDRAALEDARLVVVAGIRDPAGSVSLLRDYVRQGGQLLIAAGGEFDPAAWTASAWQDGAGILPLPLAPDPVGALPEANPDAVRPFFLDFESLRHHRYFKLADVDDEELADLYAEYFFRAVSADDSEPVLAALAEAEKERLTEEIDALDQIRRRAERWSEMEAKGTLTEEERALRKDDEQRRRELWPTWLLWSAGEMTNGDDASSLPLEPEERQRRIEALVARAAPRIVARFDRDRMPYIVERQIGRGRVVLATSGIHSGWNTLARRPAILVFDRVMKSMIESTLPRRNFEPVDQITLPIAAHDAGVQYALVRPGADPEAREFLDPGFLGAETRGLTIHHPLERGLYHVVAFRAAASAENFGGETKLWDIPLAVNGDAAESELATLGESDFLRRTEGAALKWVATGQQISLAGARILGQDWWWYLILAVLVLLLVEIVVLAWPSLPLPARQA